MKKIFRKAITVLGSAALIGATIGAAAAAAYPAPFTSNTAIIVGATAAPSDNIAASSIAANLNAQAVGGIITVEGGESYQFEKTSTKFHLGDTITAVVSSDLDEDELPILLAEGIFTDDDNDEFDFTQKISMAAIQLTMFDDNDFSKDDPTVGFKLGSNSNVLNYTLELTEEPLISDLPTADLTIMGKEYYVLAATITKLTLLDSAADTIVAEGETSTITAGGKTYTVSIEFIDSNSAKLNVNGEITNDIEASETYRLDDGSYLGMKEILYNQKDTGISKLEFSIGQGKLILENGRDIELNEDAIDGLSATITNGTDSDGPTLSSVVIQWDTDDEVFITESSVATMPGFGAVSLSFTGLDYPIEEEIEIGFDGDDSALFNSFPLQDSVEDINFLYTTNNVNFTGLGKDADEELATGVTSITFDDSVHSYFIASWSDGRDAESYMMRASSWTDTNSINKTTLQYKKDGIWTDAKTDRKEDDTFSLGNAELKVGVINDDAKTVVILNNSVQTNFNTLYSKGGMKFTLPITGEANSAVAGYINTTSGGRVTTFVVHGEEEDKDGDIGDGDDINATIGFNGQVPAEVSVTTAATTSGATASEIGDTDVSRDFTYTALATEILFDTGGDQDFITYIYHGDEVEASVFISSAEAVITGDAGVMTVMDDAVSTVAGKNLIVVGGSAINSVAAELLGGAYSEAAFTSATGVGAGEFLIESFDRAGKTALLVAGYNAVDTEKAVTFLLNEGVDTAVGNKYMGTSATEATMVIV